MAVGSTFTATMTRDQIIEAAYKKCGVLAEGETLAAELLDDGVRALNSIVRELDASGQWLWAIAAAPSSVTLVANQWVYTSAASAIPTDILEIVSAVYRDSQAVDHPLQILTPEGYHGLKDKLSIGDPSAVYLTEQNSILGVHSLYVWPTLSTVNSQSTIAGSDGNDYKCIRSHTSDSTNKPITGANYLQYWESAGTTGADAWVTATSYTAPQLILLKYKRPLYEFTAATDNPDFPPQWVRLLIYRLASDLGDDANLPIERIQMLAGKAKGAYADIFRTIRPNTTDYHNKAVYF